MNFNSFSFKILKNVKYFVLISTVIFSYNSSSTKDIYEKAEDQTDQGYINLPDHQTTVEQEVFFKDSVRPHFTNGQSFDSSRDASRAFQDECPDPYNSFGDHIDRYYDTMGNYEAEDYSSADNKDNISEIEKLTEKCKGSIYEEYTTLENKIDEGVSVIGFSSPNAILSIFNSVRVNVPKEVEDLREFFKEWKVFISQCLYQIRDKENDASNFGEFNFGDILEELHQNGCNQKKEEIKRLKSIFDKFIKTPSRCERPANTCVANLRKDVGLKSLAQGKLSLLGFISENTSVTNDCCLVTYECLHVPDAKRKHDAILQSIGGSKSKNICQSGSPERNGALQRIGDEISKTCRTSADTCLDKVQTAMDDFRKDFLKCFFLPDFSPSAYELHARNECGKRITEIKGKFEKTAKELFPTKVTLESLSSNDWNNHPFITECKEPLERLKTDRELLKTRAEGFLFHTCNESDQDESDQNQLTQGNQSGPFSIPMPHIRNNTDTGSSRSSSRNSQNQPEPPGNLGASPTSEVPYDPGQYAGPDKTKKDEDDSNSPPPSPEGDPSLFGGPENQLTAAEMKEKGISDPSASSSSPSTDPSSPDSSISGFSPSSTSSGQEGAGDLAKSDSDSSNSEGNNEKEEDGSESGKLAQNEAGSRGISSSGGFSGSSGGGSSRARRFMSRLGSRVKKPLADAWKKAFGDPSKTVKDVFNVHGPEVNLLERQKELARQFCRLHKTCEGNFETESLQ